jgi:flavin-dependent dehydrogenase
LRRAARADVLVLGCGPAGAACAVALARLGARVRVLSRPRPDTFEGLSARTLAGLRAAGLERAATAAPALAPRVAEWAGEAASRGMEAIVARARLEQALLDDVRAAGADTKEAVVRGCDAAPGGWRVQASSGAFAAPFVIDARGRRVRGAIGRGPVLVAWSERWRIRGDVAPGSRLFAMATGWCWLAVHPDGTLQLQWVGNARAGEVRRRHGDWREGLARLDAKLLAAWEQGERIAPASACAATARLALPAAATGFLRVGDASLAIDPLSGHGVHEALAGARAAAAAANTWLQGGAWRPAAQFVDQRARESWGRTLAVAADFYGLQAGHSGGAFWRRAASRYRALAESARLRDAGPGRIERRAVLDGWTIRLEDVWVSPGVPRGAWRRAAAAAGDLQ